MKATKQKILEFIVAYIQKHSYPPTVREIGEGVGLKSTASVQSHIVHMLDCGMIETDAGPKSTRAIRVPGYKFVKADGWIPADEPPKDDNYILLSFENYSCPLIGRYESDGEIGGAYYIGDCDGEDTSVANNLFVNAWMPLPEPYLKGGEDNE